MSKDKFPPIREDYDANEWGNLGDDNRLLDPKLNYKIAAKDRMANPKTRAKLSAASKKQHTKEFRKQASIRRKAQMDIPFDETGMTLREKITISNRKSAKNPIHHANRTAANRKLKNDPTWQKNHKKSCHESYGLTIITPLGEYPACTEFDKVVGKHKDFTLGCLRKYPHLFYKKEDGPGEEVYERIFHTPYGECITTNFAYELAQKNKEPNSLKLKNKENWFLKMCTFEPKKYFVRFEVAKCWTIEKNKPYGTDTDNIKIVSIKKDKLQNAIDKWNKRLEYQRSVYKNLT